MSTLGSAILRYETVTSTNDVARDFAIKGTPEGTVILAQNQSAGRGRLGRSWESPAGEGLYASIVLRPRLSPSDSSIITLAAAVAVADTLASDFDVAADIKWPNDVLASGRKICGILAETAIEGGSVQYVVLGIGVNLNQREFPKAIRETATSLFLETGRQVTPDDFVNRLLKRLDRDYRLAITDPDQTVADWEARSTYARGRAVMVTSADDSYMGTTRGVTKTGSLILELDNGTMREILSGEVTLRPSGS